MNKITVIVPIHILTKNVENLLHNSINSVINNRKNSEIDIKTLFVCPENIVTDLTNIMSGFKNLENYEILPNTSEQHDYCSQINFAVSHIDDEWFSILEYDDVYSPYWFKSVKDYYYSRENVSLFLPINVQYEFDAPNIAQFCNEHVWANGFSETMGYIDFECLDNFYSFNLTGGIFNTNDFKKIGGFKPSIQVAFNYEFLLRLTHNKLKVFVVPKEGYTHILNREGSLLDRYYKEFDENAIKGWFDLAKCEYIYKEDRGTKPNNSIEILK